MEILGLISKYKNSEGSGLLEASKLVDALHDSLLFGGAIEDLSPEAEDNFLLAISALEQAVIFLRKASRAEEKKVQK